MLDSIRLAVVKEGEKKACIVVEKVTAKQARIFSALQLDRFAPKGFKFCQTLQLLRGKLKLLINPGLMFEFDISRLNGFSVGLKRLEKY